MLLSSCGSVKSSPVEDFDYESENGEAIITGYHGTDLEIVIPEIIEDRPVTKIAYHAFNNLDITSIDISKNITYIADAFQNCTMLEKIKLPDSIREEFRLSYLEDTAWYAKQPQNEILYIDNVCLGMKNLSIETNGVLKK